MALLHVSFDEIDETHLRRLLRAAVAENRDIEYKRQPYGESDAEKAECLGDLSSFANTAGGDVLIGVDAKDGIPTKLTPLEGSADAEILRIEELARSSLQPRISLRCKAIRIETGGYVLLVRVPRSYNPPHRLIRNGKGQFRFYARSSAGKYEPNVDELRALFTLAPALAERMRDFRLDRSAKIAASAAPVPLQASDAIVVHVVPLSAFSFGTSVSLAEIQADRNAFAPLGSNSAPHRLINFDGALMLSNAASATAPQRAYVQVFQSGIVEAVHSGFAHRDARPGFPMVRLRSIEGSFLVNTLKYLKKLISLGVEPPFAIVLTLVNVKGLTAAFERTDNWPDTDDLVVIDRDHLHYGEVVIESVPNSIQELAAMVRPIIEQLAHTAGLAASPSFDQLAGYLPLYG